jgi:hypothetical protein
MVSKAKAAHEHLRNAAEQGRRDRLHAEKEFVAVAIAALAKDVVPLLIDAKTAFAEDGIQAAISEHFDVVNRGPRVMPRVSFRCQGPKRAADGYQFESTAVFFASDGNTIFVGTGTSSIDREVKHPIGLAPVGKCEDLVTKAIETALTAYYAERDRWK